MPSCPRSLSPSLSHLSGLWRWGGCAAVGFPSKHRVLIRLSVSPPHDDSQRTERKPWRHVLEARWSAAHTKHVRHTAKLHYLSASPTHIHLTLFWGGLAGSKLCPLLCRGVPVLHTHILAGPNQKIKSPVFHQQRHRFTPKPPTGIWLLAVFLLELREN